MAPLPSLRWCRQTGKYRPALRLVPQIRWSRECNSIFRMPGFAPRASIDLPLLFIELLLEVMIYLANSYFITRQGARQVAVRCVTYLGSSAYHRGQPCDAQSSNRNCRVRASAAALPLRSRLYHDPALPLGRHPADARRAAHTPLAQPCQHGVGPVLWQADQEAARRLRVGQD